MSAGPRRRLAALLCALAASPLAAPAAAGGDLGPCAPFRAPDGDVASEMPGCARRPRGAADALDAEMRFRRGQDEDAPDADDPPPARHRRRR